MLHAARVEVRSGDRPLRVDACGAGEGRARTVEDREGAVAMTDEAMRTVSFKMGNWNAAHGFLRIPDHDEEESQQRAEDGQQH